MDEGASLSNDAQVSAISRLLDHAQVSGTAVIKGLSWLEGRAHVYGTALLDGVIMSEDATIGDDACVTGGNFSGYSRVYGNATTQNVSAKGNSSVFGNASLCSDYIKVQLAGGCKFGGHATFDDLLDIDDFINKYGTGNIEIIGRSLVILTDVWDMG